MKSLLLAGLLLTVGVGVALSLSPPLPGGSADTALSDREIERLIEQLGSASFAVREEATRKLAERPDAIPALRRALKSSDLEVARRAARILKEARLESAVALARLTDLAKNGQVDEAVELLAQRERWDDEVAAWQVMVEFAETLRDLEKRRFGRVTLADSPGLPINAFRRYPTSECPKLIRARQPVMERKIRPDLVVRAEDLVGQELPASNSYLVATGSVRIIPGLSTSVVLCGGPVEVELVRETVVVCDGDFTANRRAEDSLIIARGTVHCSGIVRDCRIITSARVHYADDTKVSGTQVQEKESKPLGFVKFFDPAGGGVEVVPAEGGVRVKAAAEGKPFARAGLRAGDVVTAVDGTEVRSPDTFRRLLRAKMALMEETMFQVRRGDKVVEIAVPYKD